MSARAGVVYPVTSTGRIGAGEVRAVEEDAAALGLARSHIRCSAAATSTRHASSRPPFALLQASTHARHRATR